MTFSVSLVKIMLLENKGDQRGNSFQLPQSWQNHLSIVKNIHITTLKPGHMRGNHYHAYCQETLIVLFNSKWSFYWDSGTNTQRCEKLLTGSGAALIEIKPSASHAIRNNGSKSLTIFALTDANYNLKNPDSVPRNVTD